MTRASAVLFTALLATATLARAAHADDPQATAPATAEAQPAVDPVQEAKQQYKAGLEAYQAKRFVEAALHFEAAAANRPHAIALYTAALAWEQANRPERAADDFGRSLGVPGLTAAQSQNARERIGTIERTMGTLDVSVAGQGTEGWRVQLDANTEVLAPAQLHAMPGVHTLSIQAPGAPIRHRDVTLDLGKTKRLELTPEPAEPPPVPKSDVKIEPREPPPPPPPAPVSGGIDLRRAIGIGVIGVGVASLAGGVILGSNALDARDAYDAAPTRAGLDHASALQTWTNVTLIAGGVLVVGGAVLVLWPSPRPKTEPSVSLVPTLGGALVRGAF